MFEQSYLAETLREFRRLKDQADRAMAQVDDAAFFQTLDAESNSIAIIVKHVGGNLRSRWRDFLTTDGEKPDRDRDGEFVIATGDTRASLLDGWERGWAHVLDELGRLGPDDVQRTVRIRGEPHTVLQATQRSLAHTAGHVGQIVFLAKHFVGARWQSLSVPRRKSE